MWRYPSMISPHTPGQSTRYTYICNLPSFIYNMYPQCSLGQFFFSEIMCACLDIIVYTIVQHTMYGANVVVFEGILAFCHTPVLELMDLKIFVDTDSDIRLARRLVTLCVCMYIHVQQFNRLSPMNLGLVQEPWVYFSPISPTLLLLILLAPFLFPFLPPSLPLSSLPPSLPL